MPEMPKPRAIRWPNPRDFWGARSPHPAAPIRRTGPSAVPWPRRRPTRPRRARPAPLPSARRRSPRTTTARRKRQRRRTHEPSAQAIPRRDRRLHPDRSPGGIAHPRNHVRSGLRNLPGRAHLGRAHRGVAEALARNRIRDAHDDAGLRGSGAASRARYLGPRSLAGDAGHRRDRHAQHPNEFELRLELGTELRQPELFQPELQLRLKLRRQQELERRVDRRSDARRLVEHGRSAAQHLAACVLRPGRRRAQAQLPSQFGHRAGQHAGGSRPVHRRQGNPIALPRRHHSNLAEPVAAAGHAAVRGQCDPAGGRRTHHRIQGLGTHTPTHRGRRMIFPHIIGRGRRDPVNGCAKRMKSRGVALIIALILVALATILATKLTFDGFLERRRAIGVLAAEQALHFGMGAEALAADVLAQDLQNSPTQTTLIGPWAQPTQPLPITPQDNPEGEPIGTLQGQLEDMQGRFNLNNLAHVIAGPQGAIQDPQPLEQFRQLLQSVGLEPKWAGMARDWIDADDMPGSPDGAEDQIYTSQTPPYRTGNWPMMSPTELMNLPGFGADRYRKIAPFVTALPNADSKINVCTAPALVLESLVEGLNGEWSNSPAVLANGRKTGCFPDVTTFTNVATSFAGPKAMASIGNPIGTQSQYFQLTTRVMLGTTEFTL